MCWRICLPADRSGTPVSSPLRTKRSSTTCEKKKRKQQASHFISLEFYQHQNKNKKNSPYRARDARAKMQYSLNMRKHTSACLFVFRKKERRDEAWLLYQQCTCTPSCHGGKRIKKKSTILNRERVLLFALSTAVPHSHLPLFFRRLLFKKKEKKTRVHLYTHATRLIPNILLTRSFFFPLLYTSSN